MQPEIILGVGGSQAIRVLVIEDDPEDYLLTTVLLGDIKESRFVCERAERLDRGLSRLAEGGIDVVLLDLKLPDSQGLETFLRLRARSPDVPVVLLTGTEDDEISMIAIERGAQDYLVKGKVDREQLTRAIRYAIERTRAEVALRRYRDHLEELVLARTGELRRTNEQLQQEVAMRRRIEEEKDRLQAEVLEARKLEAVGRLAGGIAHEFNNALTVVLGYAELLQDRMETSDPRREEVVRIIEGAERAAALTRQLLAFGRRQIMHAKVIDANLFVAGMTTVVEPTLGNEVHLVFVPTNDSVTIEIDENQLQLAILNLTRNACEAMPNGGTLTLKVENVIVDHTPAGVQNATGGFACLVIQDTGRGMDPETMEHIFEPFFSTKKFGHGSGLGLTVAYGILRQHGGWIEASSRVGGGSEFRLFLPALTTDVAAVPAAGERHPSQPQGNGQLILLVEDESAVSEYLQRTLRNNGYRVAAAATASEARELFPGIRESCRLLFADVVLPGQSGLDLAEELLAANADLRVLLSSGGSDRECRMDMIRARGYCFLPKPYSVEDLLALVRTAIESRAQVPALPS